MGRLACHCWSVDGQGGVPVVALHGFTGSGLDFNPIRPLSKLCILSSGKEKIFEGPQCTKGVHEDPDEIFDIARGQKTEFRKMSIFDGKGPWYAPDLMGHGETTISDAVGDYTLEAHVEYLHEIATMLGEAFVLLGYSMGGRLALKYALERPEKIKELVLVSATAGIEDLKERQERRKSDALLADEIEERGITWFINEWYEKPLIKTQAKIPKEIRYEMLKRRYENRAFGLANSLRGMGTGSMEPLWERLGEIDCPVKLITGELDKKFCDIAKRMKDKIINSYQEVISNVGHAAIWEKLGDA